MPTYDYLCKCGEVREVYHDISKKPRVKCWKCSKPMKKQIGKGAYVSVKNGTPKFH